MFTIIPTYGFLRLPQVLALIPISKSAWWEGCKTGRFPKPVKLGPRTTVWRAEDIAALVSSFGSQPDGDSKEKTVLRAPFFVLKA